MESPYKRHGKRQVKMGSYFSRDSSQMADLLQEAVPFVVVIKWGHGGEVVTHSAYRPIQAAPRITVPMHVLDKHGEFQEESDLCQWVLR